MPQLFVLRHAKSSWGDPGLDDHDRPLAPRGRRAVELLHDYIRSHAIEPALVLCSSARRARETLDGVAPPGEVLIEPDLYAASAASILQRLAQVPADTASVMVIGHNPALQILVLRLANPDRDVGRLANVERKFPTGALATLTFDGSWGELSPGGAQLTRLVVPEDLDLEPKHAAK
jgi:phosphohistidine phosphatase